MSSIELKHYEQQRERTGESGFMRGRCRNVKDILGRLSLWVIQCFLTSDILPFFPTHSGGITKCKTTHFQQVFKIEAWVHHSQLQPVEGTPLIFFLCTSWLCWRKFVKVNYRDVWYRIAVELPCDFVALFFPQKLPSNRMCKKSSWGSLGSVEVKQNLH